MKQRTLELQKIYREGAAYLEKHQIQDAALDAWYLLEYVTGISKASYYGDPFRTITDAEAERYWNYIEKRGERIPLQHITGSQEFMGYEFLVNEHVLVPRQDTETLVEEGLKVLKPDMKVLDMCTGSGCIVLSLLKMGSERKHFTGLEGTGVDISEEALAVAKENGSRLNVSVTWTLSNLFENISGEFDLIVSNPPYIRTNVIQSLEDEVKLHDPWIALDGHDDGLYFYRRIVNESIFHMKAGGWLMFEIGYDQAKEVSELMEKAGFSHVYVKKDLAGLDRCVCGMYNKRVVKN